MAIESFSDSNNTSRDSGDKLRLDADLSDRSSHIILAQVNGFPSAYQNLKSHNSYLDVPKSSDREDLNHRSTNNDTERSFSPRASYGGDVMHTVPFLGASECPAPEDSDAKVEKPAASQYDSLSKYRLALYGLTGIMLPGGRKPLPSKAKEAEPSSKFCLEPGKDPFMYR